MTDQDLLRRFKAAESAVFRELDGEAIILHLDTGMYFGLDAVGTHIWRCLERDEPVGSVVGVLVQEFDVDEPRARLDVERLIGQLVSKGLMVPGDVAPGR